MMDAVQCLRAMAWRTERTGEFGSYVVSGWRYAEIPIWHVRVGMHLYDRPDKTYMVAAGKFLPDTASEAEKRAAMHLIQKWEAEGLDRPSC